MDDFSLTSELNNCYSAALAVVATISRLSGLDIDFLPPEIRSRRDWIDALYRNRNHLQVVLGRYEWPPEFDLQVLRNAIAQADAKLAAMAQGG